MPPGVTAPETAIRQRLIALIEAEFAPEALEVRSDRLNESLATDKHLGGVFPSQASESNRNGLVLDSIVVVQLFRQWDNKLDPKQSVDPAAIEEWAERLRRAVAVDIDAVPGDEHLWFYRVLKIDYNPDPSGNITRLQATVLADAQNSALVETAG
jgi:hypothetical protein